MKENLSIGTLSKLSGVAIETIRYYERIGVLKPHARKASGYRIFNEEAYKTLRFLKNAQELGFSLAEIKDLLKLQARTVSRCEEVQTRASKHLRSVEEKMEKLMNISSVLSRLIKQCRSSKTSERCPILECFAESGQTNES